MTYRKSAVELTDRERDAFIDAVKGLKTLTVQARDGVNTISRYDQFVAIHLGVTARFRGSMTLTNNWIGDGGHGNAAFLAWHRQFLRQFELALQEIKPEVSLPYWDWTQHDTTDNILFQDNFMGPNGGVGGNGGGEVLSGHFAGTSGWSVDARLHIGSLLDQQGNLLVSPPNTNGGTVSHP